LPEKDANMMNCQVGCLLLGKNAKSNGLNMTGIMQQMHNAFYFFDC